MVQPNVLEGLLNRADYIIEKCRGSLIAGDFRHLQGHPLYKKLAEIYAEEAAKLPRVKNVFLPHKLLEKLVRRDNLNCLIVNLYKGNEGYSLAVKLLNGVETETIRLSYENDEFLSYLDNEQLPPMLLDLLDEANCEIFYQGCIIAEVRDFRRTLDSLFDSKFILLRPTSQSIAADIASMTRNGNWSTEERDELEAEIVLRTAPPLILDPDPIVAVISNKLHRHKYKFSEVPLRRAAKRFSQVAQNRQKTFEDGPAPKALKLHEFLAEKKDRRPIPKSIPKPPIPIMSTEDESNVDSFEPHKSKAEMDEFYKKVSEDVKRIAQPLDRLQDSMDNSLVFVEEYTLETERGQGRIYLTKLTISQRRTDEIYFGELYVDRDYQEGKNNGSICRFQLGTLHQVQRYIKQFKEILTEEGRKTVKITHKVAGQAPRVVLTPGSRDKKDLDQTVKQSTTPQTHSLATDLQMQVTNRLQQGLITSFNLGVQQPSSIAGSSASVSIPQASPQNVIIVSNADNNNLKKSINIINKPITVTSSATLTGLLNAQNANQVVVGRSLNLSNLLSGRQIVSGGAVTAIQGPIVTTIPTHVQKGTGAISSVQSATKISLPTLAAQLNRPSPSYSQSVSAKSQSILTQLNAVSDSTNKSMSGETLSHSAPVASSSLQALLAGSAAAANPNTAIRNASIIEKLAAQSVMLNSSKHDDSTPLIIKQHTVPVSSLSISTPQQHQSSAASVTSSSVANMLRSDGGGLSATGPPNINLANIANLPGLNVGLQNLAQNLQGIQNVQVSFPGFTVPISLSINMSSANVTSINIVTSPSMVYTKSNVSSTVTSATPTVMIANPSAQVVQVPLSQLGSPQLAAQLTKSAQVGVSSSSLPVLQVQGMGGGLFTSVRSAAGAHQSGLQPATLHQGTLQSPPGQAQSISSSIGEISGLSHTSTMPVGSSVVTLTSKQPVQLAMSKQAGGHLTWQLQQKILANKRQQQQPKQN